MGNIRKQGQKYNELDGQVRLWGLCMKFKFHFKRNKETNPNKETNKEDKVIIILQFINVKSTL